MSTLVRSGHKSGTPFLPQMRQWYMPAQTVPWATLGQTQVGDALFAANAAVVYACADCPLGPKAVLPPSLPKPPLDSR
jgi:hypothetical protein